jgi:RNase P subunit RPR2
MDDKLTIAPQRLLACQDCHRLWLDPSERWRMYLDSDEPPHAVSYCPDCATREFDE